MNSQEKVVNDGASQREAQAHQYLLQGASLHNAGNLALAEMHYLQALKLSPRNADVLHLLGLIHKAKNQLPQAIEQISSAISIKPDEAIFINNLATCYIAKREFVVAKLCCEKALQLNSQYVDAWCNLGMIALEQERWPDVFHYVDQALKIDPQHVKSLQNKATVLYKTDHFAEALQMYAQVQQVAPKSSAAWFGIINSLEKLDRYDEALTAVEALLQFETQNRSSALHAKAGLLEVLGRIEEATQVIDEAISLKPEQIDLKFLRARIKKNSRDDNFFQQTIRFADGIEKRAPKERTELGYSLGRLFEDVGDMRDAAKYYAIGAQARLESNAYDERGEIVTNQNLIKVCDREVLERVRTKVASSESAILIVGMPRSGTTLTEQILGSHSKVLPAGELTWLLDLYDGYELTPELRIEQHSATKIDRNWTLAQRGEYYLQRLRQLPGAEGKTRFVDKLPSNYIMMGLTAAMLPDSNIIHCRRDPIDTCISCYTTLFSHGREWSYDLAAIGRHFRRYWEMMEHWREVMPGRFLEIRYEDTVDNTEGMAHQILDWVDLPFEAQCLDFHKTQRPVRTASVGQVRQPIYQSSKGRWKKWEPYIQPLLDEIGDLEEAYWAENNSKPR